MASIDITVTLPEPIMAEAIRVGILQPEAISEIVQDAVVSGRFQKQHQEKSDRADMTPEERRADIDARYDQFPVDTTGWKFNRDEIYEDLNERHGIS